MEINPELKLESYTDGLQPENASEFIAGADAVIDAIDYTCFYNTVVLHRAAKELDIPVINPQAIGFGVSVLVFGAHTVGIEEYAGLPAGASEKEINNFTLPIEKFCPYLPSYVDREVASKAASGQINIPNIIMPQHLGTAIAVSETVMMILGRVSQPGGPNPRIFILDLQERKFEVKG